MKKRFIVEWEITDPAEERFMHAPFVVNFLAGYKVGKVGTMRLISPVESVDEPDRGDEFGSGGLSYGSH
jgi:hypothetical protein